MDDRLEKALAFSQYRKTIENRKIALQRRFETMIQVPHANGMFVADQLTMTFVSMLVAQEHTSAVLIDMKSTPIDVPDLAELKTALSNAYFAATNEYAVEIRKLSKARNVKKAMDW
jgi:hypothetical protein